MNTRGSWTKTDLTTRFGIDTARRVVNSRVKRSIPYFFKSFIYYSYLFHKEFIHVERNVSYDDLNPSKLCVPKAPSAKP